MIDQFLKYVGSFDATFASRIEGASEAEIERVQRVVKGPLPSDYQEFLRLMGHRDDGIVGGDITTSIEDVLEFYEQIVAAGEAIVPNDCIVIGVGDLSIDELYLEREAPNRVFGSANDTKGPLWAASLPGLLYQRAFMRAAARQHTHTMLLSSDKPVPRLHLAQRFLDTLDVTRLWFSDEVTLCYESAGDQIAVHQTAGRGIWARLSSRSWIRLWILAVRFSVAVHVPLTPIA